jgi:hypothetical protein
MTARTVVVLALAAALAAGCSAGHSGQGMTAVRDLHDLAGKLGCTFVEDTDEHELYTSDEGSCASLGGPAENRTVDLTLYLFDGARQRESWLAFAQPFGGNYLVGSTWVVSADSPAAVKSAQAKVGGQLR